MSPICILLSWFLIIVSPPANIYDIQVQTIEGKIINFASFKGSKILIAEFDGSSPDADLLRNLEQAKKSFKNLRILAVAAIDFSGRPDIQRLLDLKQSLQLTYDIGEPMTVKKNASNGQSTLFAWLTNASNNKHFDVEIERGGQMFFVSERGSLYAATGASIGIERIREALEQTVNE